MTATAPAARPDPRAVRRGVRIGAVLALLVVAYAAASAMIEKSSDRPLDPASAAPGGTRALAEILRAHGVDVTVSDDPVATAAAARDTTIVMRYPERVSPATLDALTAVVGRGGDVLLLEPTTAVLNDLDLPLANTGGVPAAARAPGCQLPEAVVARAAVVGGGSGFRVTQPDATGVTACYPVRSAATLVVLEQPARSTSGAPAGRFVVSGSAEFMTNKQLAKEGDAALAIGLLNRHPGVTWVFPHPGGPGSVAARSSLADLLPDRVVLGCLQIAFAVVVLALWRGRRLGPPVAEPLPVVVRAAETVEGRGRLYAAGKARELAAAALRAGLRARLAQRLGLATRPSPAAWREPAAAHPEPDPDTLVISVADRTGRPPVEIGSLLYGSGMSHPMAAATGMSQPARTSVTDHELVELAHRLDALDRQVMTQ
ncbi:DUF4350 domain-containing protein [Frankia sp. CiP3]|uniref:DUF4350 domain-containing protein n=1 Tax=Frankia sp. CiP3 TaxID=2880971 RepID=UPI001EF54E33|nr:DUF4350 domain-containing protein [Frankia sp. CiP3]